jgi:hypothetical protein
MNVVRGEPRERREIRRTLKTYPERTGGGLRHFYLALRLAQRSVRLHR